MKKQLITTLTALIIASSQALPAAQSVTAPLPETAITASAVDNTPAKVTGVKASKTGYTTTVLSWKKVSNAKGYRVYMYDPNVGKYRKMTTINKNSTTSYTVVQIEPGKTHKFKVRAYRKVGGKTYWGTPSAALSVTTKSYAPAKVTGLKANANSQTAGTLTWKKIADATGYRVYVYNTSTKKYTKVTTLSGNTKTSCKVTGLKAGTSYKYKVRAYRKADGRTYWGTSSAAVTLTTLERTFSKVDLAYQALIKGNSTKAQRELIRSDLIEYAKKLYPHAKLDESHKGWLDADGNGITKRSQLVMNQFDSTFGSPLDYEMEATAYFYLGKDCTQSTVLKRMYGEDYDLASLADKVKESYYYIVEDEEKTWGKFNTFNIVYYLDDTASSYNFNTGDNMPFYLYIMPHD